ncbi:nuclear transport factor 2 family protein [Zavarzinia sp. CC-PAN008]|uniref:nuclear transport factor 2 family protein n=1 Tax=Zavarzinia sp. CC-PAN008 TaxID=3243332 RepID=UPI003F748D46
MTQQPVQDAARDPMARWHHMVAARDLSELADLVAADGVFLSPVVHAPQVGRALVVKYLTAALSVLNNGTFRYVGEWRAERSAVLEFELELDGLYANGVDIIHWDEDGRITTFKVMMRPLKAVNAVIPRMAALLQAAG